MNINTLEEEDVQGNNKRAESRNEDEVLLQLTIHTLKKVSTKTIL
jgi:hypothetical protein